MVAGMVVLASISVQGCSCGRSITSNATNSRNNNETQSSAQCDPNYSGCVPIASDVDCAGGKGNGPAYVKGPVKVIGNDIYGLDKDGNGIGCE